MPEKVKITFLGTSGAVPTPERNHPAILLCSGKENVLVDCGEGTQTQFRKAKISAAKLTKLLITHWHGDHVLGIPGLLQTLSFQDYNKILRIYGPRGIEKEMDNVLKAFPSVVVNEMRNKLRLDVKEASRKFIDEEDFFIEAFPVEHGIASNGYCFVIKDKMRIDKNKLKKLGIKPGKHLAEIKKGKTISYNGKRYSQKDLAFVEKGRKICIVMDGIYEPGIVRYAKESDALIMESAYTDEFAELAKEHKHRTAKQCAEIAKKSDAKRLFLTHLTNRYDKNPEVVLNEAKKTFKNSFLAQDLKSFEI
ncbi:MAG: ribonuclease Z [Candidatus Pacearchaeota archaeon]|nr:ribonuclease Z [Candidatus Pacearchaeota archaeon]